MKVTKKVLYNVEDFNLKFEPIEDSIKIEKTKEGFTIKYLTYDNDPMNLFENDEGLGNFFHWKEHGKEQEIKYCELLGYDIDSREQTRKENLFAVRIDKYEHSGISYSVAGEGRQCRWDTSSTWAVWFPTDCLIEDIKRFKTKKAQRNRCIELAREACETFNQWANGEVYYIVKEEYTDKKEYLNHDICGGYYGYEYAEKALETDI